MVPTIVIGAIALLVGAVVGFVIQRIQRNAAEHSAAKIRSNAEKEAEHVLREARVSAKEKINKLREECEAELKRISTAVPIPSKPKSRGSKNRKLIWRPCANG